VHVQKKLRKVKDGEGLGDRDGFGHQGFRDGFVRMEQMKMAREIEAMRMEMEMKLTEMILESQQLFVEAFAKAFSEKSKKKKAKRMPSPPEA
jgi:hypothetical protein